MIRTVLENYISGAVLCTEENAGYLTKAYLEMNKN